MKQQLRILVLKFLAEMAPNPMTYTALWAQSQAAVPGALETDFRGALRELESQQYIAAKTNHLINTTIYALTDKGDLALKQL